MAFPSLWWVRGPVVPRSDPRWVDYCRSRSFYNMRWCTQRCACLLRLSCLLVRVSAVLRQSCVLPRLFMASEASVFDGTPAFVSLDRYGWVTSSTSGYSSAWYLTWPFEGGSMAPFPAILPLACCLCPLFLCAFSCNTVCQVCGLPPKPAYPRSGERSCVFGLVHRSVDVEIRSAGLFGVKYFPCISTVLSFPRVRTMWVGSFWGSRVNPIKSCELSAWKRG